jgi:hypothetical protein
MKVFQMNDCDWWMAPSLTQAIVGYVRHCGCTISDNPDAEELHRFEGAEIDGARELTEAELDSITYHPDEARAVSRTFREELALRVAEGARSEIFATTEF